MEFDARGRPVTAQRLIGTENRDGMVFYTFSKPGVHITRIKTYQAKGYIVGYVTWFSNLYVDYIAVDTNIHNPQDFLKKRLNQIINTARTHGWNKRLTAEAAALSLILLNS